MQLLAGLPVLSATIMSPIYPIMLRELGLSNAQLGTIASTGTLVALVTSLTIGVIKINISRYRLMQYLLTLYITGLLVCASAFLFRNSAYVTLLFGRCLIGMGEIGGLQQVIACLSSDSEIEDKSRVFGKVEASASAGAASGPIIGSVLATVAWWLGYAVPAILMAVILITLARSLSNLKYFRTRVEGNKSKGKLGISKYTIIAGFSCLFLMFALSAMQTFVVGYFIKEIGMKIGLAGLFVAVHALCMAIAASIIGKRNTIRTVPTNISLGLFTFGLLLFMLTRLTNIGMIFASAIIGGLGCGIILPSANLLSSQFSNIDNAQTSTSIVYTLRISGSVLGPLTFGLLLTAGYRLTFTIFGTILIAASFILFRLMKNSHLSLVKE